MKRELNIIFLADCSDSMKGEPIRAVNHAIGGFLLSLKKWKDHRYIVVRVKVIAFSSGAIVARIPLSAHGETYLHSAYDVLFRTIHGMPATALAPILILLSDGLPSSDLWKEYLNQLQRLILFRKAQRYAVGYSLGETGMDVLRAFTGSNRNVSTAFSPKELGKTIDRIARTVSDSHVKRSTGKIVLKIIADDLKLIRKRTKKYRE